MPIFQVIWTEEMWHSTYIEAKSEDEAREMVFSGQITSEPYESEIQDSVEVRLVDHFPPEEKEPLDPVFPLCQMCTDPADIVCRVTPDSPGLYVCYRCHRSHIVKLPLTLRTYPSCYDHHSAT